MFRYIVTPLPTFYHLASYKHKYKEDISKTFPFDRASNKINPNDDYNSQVSQLVVSLKSSLFANLY